VIIWPLNFLFFEGPTFPTTASQHGYPNNLIILQQAVTPPVINVRPEIAGQGWSRMMQNLRQQSAASFVRILILNHGTSRKRDLRPAVVQNISPQMRERIKIDQINFNPKKDHQLRIIRGPRIEFDPHGAFPPTELLPHIGEPDILLINQSRLPLDVISWHWQMLDRAHVANVSQAMDVPKLSSFIELHDSLDVFLEEIPGQKKQIGNKTHTFNAVDKLRNAVLIALQNAKSRAELDFWLDHVDTKILPLMRQAIPAIVKTYPVAADWLAFGLMHDTSDFIDEFDSEKAERLFNILVLKAIRIAPIRTLAHLFTAFGPHLRLIAGDRSDVHLAFPLLPNVARHSLRSERYAGALVSGLIFHLYDDGSDLEEYKKLIQNWDRKLRRRNIYLRDILGMVFRKFKHLFPPKAPIFLTFIHLASGDRFGDHLTRLNAALLNPISSWEALTGLPAARAILRLIRKSGYDNGEKANHAAVKYQWLRAWALDEEPTAERRSA
jgi:hypothetical protein